MTGARSTEAESAGSEIAERLRASGEALLVALIDRLAMVAREQVDQLSEKVDDLREHGGAGLGALLAGAQSAMAGRNPVLGAIKGGFAALTTPLKVATVLAAILAPVLLLVVLLVLVVLGAVAAVRSNPK